jgi:hypothetical protein
VTKTIKTVYLSGDRETKKNFLGGDRDTNKRVFELKMRNLNKSYWVKTEKKKDSISLVNRYIYI